MKLAERLTVIEDRVRAARLRGGHQHPVTLVAVTKTHPVEAIIDSVKSGLTHIGENRVQEAAVKFPQLPSEIIPVKHLIGHLQSNKMNKALSLFDRFDSVDSFTLAEKINRKCSVAGRKIPVLLEVNTSGESTKSGFHPEDMDGLLACLELPNIRVDGLMTIGPLTDDKKAVRSAFQRLVKVRDRIHSELPRTAQTVTELSMGMSGDFEIAVEEGSTMIRLGTALLGPREKQA